MVFHRQLLITLFILIYITLHLNRRENDNETLNSEPLEYLLVKRVIQCSPKVSWRLGSCKYRVPPSIYIIFEKKIDSIYSAKSGNWRCFHKIKRHPFKIFAFSEASIYFRWALYFYVTQLCWRNSSLRALVKIPEILALTNHCCVVSIFT